MLLDNRNMPESFVSALLLDDDFRQLVDEIVEVEGLSRGDAVAAAIGQIDELHRYARLWNADALTAFCRVV